MSRSGTFWHCIFQQTGTFRLAVWLTVWLGVWETTSLQPDPKDRGPGLSLSSVLAFLCTHTPEP